MTHVSVRDIYIFIKWHPNKNPCFPFPEKFNLDCWYVIAVESTQSRSMFIREERQELAVNDILHNQFCRKNCRHWSFNFNVISNAMWFSVCLSSRHCFAYQSCIAHRSNHTAGTLRYPAVKVCFQQQGMVTATKFQGRDYHFACLKIQCFVRKLTFFFTKPIIQTHTHKKQSEKSISSR